jgi:hypothetical protein
MLQYPCGMIEPQANSCLPLAIPEIIRHARGKDWERRKGGQVPLFLFLRFV